MNAFEVLGLAQNADEAQVRAAYRSRVKTCHPDRFTDAGQQAVAQEQLIRLNLAYEEALKFTSQRQIGYRMLPASEAKQITRSLMIQGKYSSALRQLARADLRDDEWFYIQGGILMALRQWSSAQQSYREAVRRRPDNIQYRRGAFDAAMAVKKHQRLPQRMADSIHDLFWRKP